MTAPESTQTIIVLKQDNFRGDVDTYVGPFSDLADAQAYAKTAAEDWDDADIAVRFAALYPPVST